MLMDAVASAVGGGRALAPVQRSLLESLLSAMTGHRATVPDRPSMTPADIAQSMARRELSFRTRMVQVMLLCVLLLHPIPEDVAERIAATSAELGVEDGMVDVARELAAGSLALAKQDFVRNGYEGTWHGEESAAALHSARELQVVGILGRRRGAGGAVVVARDAAGGQHRAQGLGAVPGAWLHVPGHARVGTAAAGAARLGARPGGLRHDGRI